jgi:phosphopantothenoylcysteine decarboxylase/phosphopantothenate--cysteine ligase
MWEHAATQRNLTTLRADGINFVGPDEGEMACGEYGPGRMAEPPAILAAVADLLGAKAAPPKPMPRIVSGAGKPLVGRRVLVTSGPTQEPIDPVRYIANRSSGKQGHALARAAAALGAEVTLVSGPVTLPDPPGVRVVKVDTAHEMLAEVLKALPADVAICAAAVADWRASDESAQKLKKEPGSTSTTLALSLNPDILATLAKPGPQRPRLVIGFAAETDELISHAQAKLARKGCDWIVANDVSPATGVMGGDRNTVHLLMRDGEDISVDSWPVMTKEQVATELVARIAKSLEKNS